jgi:hypothetical protein
VDVRCLRQRLRIDLHDRADHHVEPSRRQPRHALDEVSVEAFVDDAEIPEARARDRDLVVRLVPPFARLREVGRVDARREAIHRWMAVLLRFVQTTAAGEDEIGPAQQLGLARG